MIHYSYAEPSPFPPSFEGNPWGYAFGLFGDVLAASLALAMLLGYLFEARRARQIDKMLRNPLLTDPIPAWSPLALYRLGKITILLFIVMRTLPDAAWMLAWGEVSEPVIRVLLAADLWMDGAALAPFFVSIACWAWGRQVIPQKLIEGNAAFVAGHPPWDIIWKNGRIVVTVFVIALGVTIGKASGA